MRGAPHAAAEQRERAGQRRQRGEVEHRGGLARAQHRPEVAGQAEAGDVGGRRGTQGAGRPRGGAVGAEHRGAARLDPFAARHAPHVGLQEYAGAERLGQHEVVAGSEPPDADQGVRIAPVLAPSRT